jgi:hypothetical protein
MFGPCAVPTLMPMIMYLLSSIPISSYALEAIPRKSEQGVFEKL